MLKTLEQKKAYIQVSDYYLIKEVIQQITKINLEHLIIDTSEIEESLKIFLNSVECIRREIYEDWDDDSNDDIYSHLLQNIKKLFESLSINYNMYNRDKLIILSVCFTILLKLIIKLVVH
jgi:hypothetical protein